MDAVLQAVVSGLVIGAIYAMVALGLNLIFGVMDVLNFAHGSFLLMGMYFAVGLNNEWGIDPYVAAVLAIPVFLAVGAAVERSLIRPTIGHGHLVQLLVTMGLMLIIDTTFLVTVGPTPRAVDVSYKSETVNVLGTFLTYPRLISLLLVAALTVGLFVFLKISRWGIAMRALSDNREGGMLVGIPAGKMNALVFGLGIALAAAAGAAVTPYFYVSPFSGQSFLIKAFVVLFIGGLGSFPGALVGGLLVGVLESLGTAFAPAKFGEFAAFSALLLILLVRPQGLFAPARREG